jgi:hypothetical protein
MISYTRELDEFCKVGVAQHLTTHGLAAYTVLIDSDFFCAGIYVDDPGCKAILETGCKVGWYGICFVQNDVR